jgi:hypothetical protein
MTGFQTEFRVAGFLKDVSGYVELKVPLSWGEGAGF